MHGTDKQFYEEMVSTIGAGVVGRGMYDAAGWFAAGLDEALSQATEAAKGGEDSTGTSTSRWSRSTAHRSPPTPDTP
ncbi:hypothetical protein ACFY36_01580 [Actinoplanes sp. NPDC000266]